MNAKGLFFKAVILCLFACLVTPLKAATPWLHTDANLIKDPQGNVVVLRGVDTIDLGSLEMWEGGVINMIDRLTNKSNTEGNSPGWYPRIIRLAVYPKDSGLTSPWFFETNQDYFYNNLLRPVVDYCKTKDLYAIVDWHYVAPTYSHVATTNAFWTYIAPKFANDSHVLFELFQEPSDACSTETARWLSVRANMQNWINIVRTYAPNNLILVGSAGYSTEIGLSATYPLTGDNLVMVSHIYPGHWLTSPAGNNSFTTKINTCLTRYPVFMSEWGFTNDVNYDDSWHGLMGTITNYGQPIMNFREARKMSGSAWVASYDWGPPMFHTDWTLRVGEGEMGGFVKDKLYEKRNADQPVDGDMVSPAVPTGLTATASLGKVSLNWDDNAESDLLGYDIYRSTTPGDGYSRINAFRSKHSDYIDITVANNTTYYYLIVALDTSYNQSDVSDEVSATTPPDTTRPAAPMALTASAGNATVSLNWIDSPETDFAGYNVYRSTTQGSGYIKLNDTLLSSSDYNDNSVVNGTTYYYVVTAVDTSSNESLYSNEVSATPINPAMGTILCEWWTGITGTAVSDLTSDVNYPNKSTGRELLLKLEGPTDWNDNYGNRIRGYLNPAVDGDYTFWIASDDDSELWLSTNDNPANISLIASVTGNTAQYEWNKYPSQQSSPISLSAGQKYYIEVLHKESTGNDNIAVAWQGPGISQQVIQGSYLSPCCLEFRDFADFAVQWKRNNCNSGNDWCEGFDFNRNGSVTLDDLQSFVYVWLEGD